MKYYLKRIDEKDFLETHEIFTKIDFEIKEYFSEEKDDEIIGSASISISKDLSSYSLDDIFWELDELAGGEYIFYNLFEQNNKLTNSLSKNYVFILNELCLKEEKQNLGIGSTVLNYLEEIYGLGRLKLLFAGPIVFNKGNYEGHDYLEVKKRLNRFYSKNKYKILKKIKLDQVDRQTTLNIYYKK